MTLDVSSINMTPVSTASTQTSAPPKIYSVEEHGVSADQIDENAAFVITKLRQAGYKAYLVGGGIRDLLLKQKPKDFDISTSAKPEEIKAVFRNAILIGRRFRLAHIRFGKKIIEVATFRSGDPDSADLIVRDNVWGSEAEDVFRRDFTLNGLLYDLENQTVIDYVGGYQDLEKRVLRAIGQPDMRFAQDPVRMIRLIKFCARFDFHIDEATFKALLNCKNEIIKSSSARILEELLRMLESSAAKMFFHLLHEYGLLRPLLPGIASYFEQNPENEILALLHEVDATTRKKTVDRSILLAALLFPLFRNRLYTLSQTISPHVNHVLRAIRHSLTPYNSSKYGPTSNQISSNFIPHGQKRAMMKISSRHLQKTNINLDEDAADDPLDSNQRRTHPTPHRPPS